MLEGVLKAWRTNRQHGLRGCFNPWYVGGGVKRIKERQVELIDRSFNPWYVGGGVKSPHGYVSEDSHILVSILGMLEGVLKVHTRQTPQ